MDTIKYDYSHIPEWADLEKQREHIVTMMKVLEDTENGTRAELPVKRVFRGRAHSHSA